MKNVTLIALFLAGATATFGQTEIPQSVLLTFDELHPTVDAPLWEQREGALVATFNDREGFKKVFFSGEGQWLETRVRIARASLPAGVASFIQRHYAEADITFLAKVSRAGAVIYRVESELPGEIVVKELDESGNLLQEKRIRYDSLLTPDSGPGSLPIRAGSPIGAR